MFLQATRRRARSAAVGVAAVALLAAGCGSSGGTKAQADTLIAYTGQAGDYQVNFNPYSPSMIEGPGNIFEPLFVYNVARNQDPTPKLGTDHQWNEDGTELDITLREGVKWSDGKPFTADDVVFTLDMIAKTPSMNATGYRGKATAVDTTHVRIVFEEPSFMEGPQILGKFWMVPKHIWSTFEDPATNVVEKPVGTGPYTLKEFKPQAFTLTANTDYWDGAPEVRNIQFLALSGNQAGADALAAGKIDWQTGPVPDIANVAKTYPGYQAVTVPMNQTVLMTCANADLGCKGPQTDPAVRQAIYHALNRTQINKLAFQDTSSEISPGFALPERDEEWVSDTLENRIAPMEPDAARAAQILQDAGYTRGSDDYFAKDGRKVSLTIKVVTGWTDYIDAVKAISEQLKQAGIEVTPQQSSWNEWSDSRGQGNFELLIDSLYPGPSPDPYFVYSYFFSEATTTKVGEAANPNFSRYHNDRVEAALAELKKISPEDVEARKPHYDRIQQQIERDMPYIPVLTGGTTSEYNDRKFDGWPTEDDLYAFPAVWSRPDNSVIFSSLKPAK